MRCSNVISVFVTVVVALVVAAPAAGQITVYSESFDTNAADNAAFDSAYSGWSEEGDTLGEPNDPGRVVSNGQLEITQQETGFMVNSTNAASIARTINGMGSAQDTYTWQMGGASNFAQGQANVHVLIDNMFPLIHPGFDAHRVESLGPFHPSGNDPGPIGAILPADGTLADFTLVVTPDPVNTGNELYELTIAYPGLPGGQVTRNFGDFDTGVAGDGVGLYDASDGIDFWVGVSRASTFGTGLFDNLTASIPGSSLDAIWNKNGTGSWTDDFSWDTLEAPITAAHSATFSGAITAPTTVVVDTDVTVNAITFDHSVSYGVAGQGSINLTSSTQRVPRLPSVTVDQGDHDFQVVTNLKNDTTANVASGSRLIFNNALNLNGNTLTKTGAGEMAIRNDLVAGGGTISVQEGTVSGNGTVGGNVMNDGGIISPGNNTEALTQVPEPSTLALLVLGGLLGVWAWRR